MRRTCLALMLFLFAIVAVAQPTPRRHVVINEILFDPRPGSSDYIELHNRGDTSIDISTLLLTNRTSSGYYGVLKKLCDTTRYLLPGGYIVFTEDAQTLALHYFVKHPDVVIELASLPSYPNAEGAVVLVDSAGNLVDDVHYYEDWHFELLADAEGVALERIDPNGISNEGSNWRSAASDAGYGTPGYQNSNFNVFQNPIATVTVTSKIFSPDGDGVDDVAAVEYNLPESGFVGNVFIYDASGRQVRHLTKNAVLGTAGNFTWNGLDERGQRLPIGQYLVYIELFNLAGKKQQFKKVIVLARRVN